MLEKQAAEGFSSTVSAFVCVHQGVEAEMLKKKISEPAPLLLLLTIILIGHRSLQIPARWNYFSIWYIKQESLAERGCRGGGGGRWRGRLKYWRGDKLETFNGCAVSEIWRAPGRGWSVDEDEANQEWKGWRALELPQPPWCLLARSLLRCLLIVKLHCKSFPALTAALRSDHVQYAL